MYEGVCKSPFFYLKEYPIIKKNTEKFLFEGKNRKRFLKRVMIELNMKKELIKSDYFRRIREYILKQHLCEPGDQVVLGLSGGPDSVFLLEVLDALQEELELVVSCVHVNHGIRGEEAERDQAFCMKLCTRKDIPCTVICVDAPAYAAAHKIGMEESARILRYQALEEVRSTLEEVCGLRAWIAVAHHADDQAETVLHNLIRGSGLKGLGGMESRQGNIIRPLLCVERAEIESWMEEYHQESVTDSSNQDMNYTRNRIRSGLMPQIRDLNAQAVAHINQAAGFAAEADAYLKETAEIWIAEHCQETETEISDLKALKPLLRRYVLMELIRKQGVPLKDWGSRHLEDLEALLDKQGGAHLDLPYRLSAEKRHGKLLLQKHNEVLSMKYRKHQSKGMDE